MLLLGVGEHVTQHCLDLVGTILCVLILVLLREADLGVLFVETSVPRQENFRHLLLNRKAQTVVYDAKLLVQLIGLLEVFVEARKAKLNELATVI